MASPFQKIGTKKLRKIKEKAERKAVREVCFLFLDTSVTLPSGVLVEIHFLSLSSWCGMAARGGDS